MEGAAELGGHARDRRDILSLREILRKSREPSPLELALGRAIEARREEAARHPLRLECVVRPPVVSVTARGVLSDLRAAEAELEARVMSAARPRYFELPREALRLVVDLREVRDLHHDAATDLLHHWVPYLRTRTRAGGRVVVVVPERLRPQACAIAAPFALEGCVMVARARDVAAILDA